MTPLAVDTRAVLESVEAVRLPITVAEAPGLELAYAAVLAAAMRFQPEVLPDRPVRSALAWQRTLEDGWAPVEEPPGADGGP